jgi:hypothetical protein
MFAQGETREKALQNLRAKLNSYREKNKTLPRPGQKVPMPIVSMEHISKYRSIGIDFFRRVLDKDYARGIFTDLTSLDHFEPIDKSEATKWREEVIQRTLEFYGIDITKEYDGVLYKIFELIKSKQQS